MKWDGKGLRDGGKERKRKRKMLREGVKGR